MVSLSHTLNTLKIILDFCIGISLPFIILNYIFNGDNVIDLITIFVIIYSLILRFRYEFLYTILKTHKIDFGFKK